MKGGKHLSHTGITRRGVLLGFGAGCLWPAEALAIGPSSSVRLGLLRYSGQWNTRPNGLRKLMQEMEKRTSVAIDPRPTPIESGDRETLFSHPLVFWSGSAAFEPLPEGWREVLGTYLRAGGMLVIDCADGDPDGGFATSARREIRHVLAGKDFQKVPRSHVLYKSFYLIKDPVGRTAKATYMDAVFSESRALVLCSYNDLMGAWSRDNLGRYEFEVFPGGPQQRELAYRLGINILMYALCVNYKEDQVHVPFILKRRKWRVD